MVQAACEAAAKAIEDGYRDVIEAQQAVSGLQRHFPQTLTHKLREPLSENAEIVYEMLIALPPYKAMTAP
jgi:hypothetical protein